MATSLKTGRALNTTNAQALAARRRKRARRRLAAWGAFLLLGLLLGAIYATGFATTGGTGTAASPANVTGKAAANENSAELKEELTTVTSPLSYSWAGRWGSIATAVMYQADLGSFTTGDTFFSEVVLTNTPAEFSDLQLQLRIAKIGSEKTCSADGVAALESSAAGGGAVSTNKRVMVFDAADAQVTFSGMEGVTTGLLGGSKYCIGIVNYPASGETLAAGKDKGGTFIRKAKAGTELGGLVYPSFIATLNRM